MDYQQTNDNNQDIAIEDTTKLKVMIRNNQGKPIYIVENNKNNVATMLLQNGVSQVGLLDNIFKALQDDLKKDAFRPIKPNEANSPIILLVSSNNERADLLYKTLTNANFVVYRQDINKPIEPITCSSKDEIKARIVEQYRHNYSVGGNIADFNDIINTNVNTPAIPTGFDLLDKVIDGGLYEGLYTVGAISSLGKTTFCMNIADQIARQGQDVIILSLEMSKYQLMSKSISRLTFCHYQNDDSIQFEWCKTSRGITDGSRYQQYCPQELELIRQAKDFYAKEVGQHLFIYEAVGDMTVESAEKIVKQHIEYTGNRPVVIVDYLQLLQHPDKYINGNDKLRTDVNITTLKRLSRDHKIPLILISSLNRMSYQSPISFEAFKESGAIEYSSDVVIGLQLAGVGRSDFNVNEAKAKNPREIELTILKNREGKIGQLIKYSYYPMFNHFVEDEIIDE